MSPAHAGSAPALRYLRHVDGLRALAVLSVIAYHAAPGGLGGGYLGVDAFFAISGFVVTAALAQHGSERLGSFIAGFYRRRLARIAPALLVVLLATALAWVLLVPRSWLSNDAERVGLYAFAGLSNWALGTQSDAYFAPRAEFNPFTHTWSLGVEEQFYLVAPWLIFAAWRWRRASLALLGVLCALSLALCALWTFSQPTQAFYNLASRFWELGAGALWYLVIWHRKTDGAPEGARPGRAWWPWASLALLVATMVLARPQFSPFPWALGAIVATLALIGRPGAAPHPVRRLLEARLLHWFGLRSYSLYLWHWPVFVLMRWTWGLETAPQLLAALALSVTAAALSYRLVEVPVRASPLWRRLPQNLGNAVLLGAVAIAAGSAAWLFQQRDQWSLSTVERHRLDWYPVHNDPTLPPAACADEGPRYRSLGAHTVIELVPCARAGLLPRRLFVLGDSHATAYLGMLHRLARDEQVHVSAYQIPGCPYVDLMAPMGRGRPPQCLSGARAALDDVLAQARPGDQVLMASLRLPRFGDQWGNVPAETVLAQHFSAEQAQARAAAVADSDAWVKPLIERGLLVVLSAPPPIFRAPPFRCVDPWSRRNPLCAAGLSEQRADEQAYRAPVMQALAAVQARHAPGSVSLFDPFDTLCGAERCSAIGADGRPLFFDGDHVSRWGNEVLYPAFRQHWQQRAAAAAPR